ncbi:MAG: peptidoglycan-binding protein [Patescibacteria group bacterium]
MLAIVHFFSTIIDKNPILTKSRNTLITIMLHMIVAVFFLSAVFSPPLSAQASHDFLYKFGSYWSDVTTDGASSLYAVNSTYSQIDKYSTAGIHQTSNWGGYGTTLGKLKQPQGIIYAGSNLYVADTGNHRIQRFNTSGVADESWGSYGANSGQFNEPYSVAVDSAETYLFVADTKNNRIQVVTIADGSVASVAGSLGVGVPQFSSPQGIAVIGSSSPYRVFVADTGNNRIVEYSFDATAPEASRLTYVAAFGSYGLTADNTFNQPKKIHIDASEYIYITDTTNRIQKYNNGRNFVRQWSTHDSRGTTGLTSISTALYVGVPYHQIDSYNSQFGTYSSTFTHESNQPIDVALDLSGNIYLNNETTNTLSKFSASWVPLAEWEGQTSDFSGARGIGVNTGGEVCVADTGNNRIQRFQTDGTYLSTLPTPLVTPVGFSGPKDIAMESTGKMYVADTGNNRILKYKSDNTPDWAIGLPTPTYSVGAGTPTPIAPTGPYFLNPYGITVDSQNKIYIADSGYHRIQKFDANGLAEKAWGEYGTADNRTEPQFDTPQGMAIEETGTLGLYYIYVADTGNNRIQRFDQDGVKDPAVDVWGVYGSGDGQFNEPRNIALDSSNRIYVSEVQNRRIQVFGDADLTAGLTIVETGGTAVTEDGSVYDSYTVRLNSQPSANVTVAVTSADSTQVTVSSTSLTFTPYNWNVPQIVTVIPVHDFIDQTITQSIVISHSVSSTDTNYNSAGVSVASVQTTLTDTDTYGITRSKDSVTVGEMGTTESYTLVLDTKPTADVVINITSADSQTLSNGADPLAVTFTATNWSTPQTVLVSAVHDDIDNGSRDSYINFSVTTTDTSGYQDYAFASTFIAHITDVVDIAGVTLGQSTLTLTEGGSAATYTVVLNTKPTSDVIITPTASSAAELIISPATLTFTSTNYATAQTVSVTAVNDHIVNETIARDVGISHTSSSTDPNYLSTVPFTGGTDPPQNVVVATITDIDIAGFVMTETGGGTSIIEGQTTDTYTVNLLSKPLGDIVYLLTATKEATTSSRLYTFTPSNWSTPQTVTVSGINNLIYEGTHSATITHTVLYTTAHDPNYATDSAHVLSLTITDTDYPGITITQPNGAINLTEYGITDTYYVKLNTEPLADVTVTIDGASQVTSSPTSLSFTSANWSTNQPATLSAVSDYLFEGSHTAPVVHTTSSTDDGYDGLTSTLTVNITDDDTTVPGIQITQTGDSTTVTEGGDGDTYTMVLTSRPTSYVRIRVLSNNSEATTSGALFTFLTTNWNIPQTVYVSARNDSTVDGQTTSIFQHIVSSPDLHYNGMSVENVTVYVNDNDGASGSSAVSAPTCQQTPPHDAPNLFQIDAAQNSATLYFTPLKDNISYYFIAYGLSPGDIRYGVSFDYGPYTGVIDYTINMLAPGTKYYYKVRGGNGCAPGPWGNEMSATTMATGSARIRSYYASSSSSWAGTGSGSTASSGSHPIFTRDLYPGYTGADVRSLQIYLNQNGFILASSGPGSPGNETTYYGARTTAAVRRFQEAHYQEILSPLGYSSGTGIFGPSTRAYVNSH